ncbi:uncharacterized protein FA14DRAFT_177940 [Meira miltonrushii]|uniref:Uncharacterized protein n=1 Tax=Meira miltonrushii TaxID=1280837 RepID=A0A316VB89_9BASI|nr:uncharacterized protein FA14DRAFT_177940 [Meira miltonrushii]PWN34534.1 hypothetical protein FA14DRAFT_177940 [Meira miltonrushii]
MTSSQMTAPPSYDQVCNNRPGFPEAKRINSTTKSLIGGSQSKFDRIQLRLRFSKLYSSAISVSKNGIAGVKHTGGSYGSNQITLSPQQADLRSICSNTSGISKPCRGCFEGVRCNQLGSPRNRRIKQVTQYTLAYSYSEEHHKEQQKALETIDDSTVFL